MKNLKFLIVLIFVSCGQSTIRTEEIEYKEPEEVSNEQNNYFSYSDLANKVFYVGSVTHFTDSCAFYFECDCCAGQYIFNEDSSFYLTDFCVGDQTLTKGKFNITADTLAVNFSGYCVTRNYNWENEVDDSAIDYFFTDTIITPFTLKYLTVNCGKKIKFIRVNRSEIGIETMYNYSETINSFRKEELLGRLEKIEQ